MFKNKGPLMIAVFTVLLVVAVSLVVIRVGTVGLTMTGVSRDLAQFQALSAFTGSGFTTRESEEIVNHPVRRRIVMHLMLLGNAGIVVAIASVSRFVLKTDGGDDWFDSFWVRLMILTVGLVVLWVMAISSMVETVMWKVNTWALSRWTKLDLRDYTRLLHLARDYEVSELRVHQGDWVAGRTLADLQLAREGILVLGIETSEGHFVGTPHGTTRINSGDCLVLYGKQESLVRLDDRQAGFDGNADHMIAVTRQLEEDDDVDE